MNIIKFITINSSHSTLHIGYKEKYIEETNNTKFLGSEIDNHIKWKNHIKQGISKLSGAGLQLDQWSVLVMYTLKSVYYEYFHSVKKYRIILGGGTLPTVGSISL